MGRASYLPTEVRGIGYGVLCSSSVLYALSDPPRGRARLTLSKKRVHCGEAIQLNAKTFSS